jgi:hypothetical protein
MAFVHRAANNNPISALAKVRTPVKASRRLATTSLPAIRPVLRTQPMRAAQMVVARPQASCSLCHLACKTSRAALVSA